MTPQDVTGFWERAGESRWFFKDPVFDGALRVRFGAALAEARSDVLLTVNPLNQAAVKLYENFGYRIRERVEGYYRPHEHRYVMVYSPPNP